MNKEDLAKKSWFVDMAHSRTSILSGDMTSKDFMHRGKFRLVSDRNCLNCMNCETTPVKYGAYGETTGGDTVCQWNLFNRKTAFSVGKRTVCDYWRPRPNDRKAT